VAIVAGAIRYRAFLSYSHRDTAWSKWLQRALERFRIGRDLVGRATPAGLVPKTLRPIFRDREDFSGGSRLPDATVAALHASAALLVLCSTASARRPAVNEVVRLFRSRHPDRPVIPIIVDDKVPENLPPALRYELSPDGTITDREVGVLGPDLRESGDGKSLGLAKVIAGLTGIDTDEILRSAEQARRRSQQFRAVFAGLFLAFAVVVSGGAVFAWHQLKTNEALLDATLKRATKIVNGSVVQAKKYNVSRTATLALLGRAEGLFNTAAEHGRPTPGLRYRRAWMLIQFARSYQMMGDPGKQYARATKAHHLLAGLGAERPDDMTYRRDLADAYNEIGDVLLAQGKLTEALRSYRDGLAVTEQLAKAAPTNAAWQRDLSVSYDKVGDLLVAEGNRGEALRSYRDGLAVREQLAKADPTNAGWQRDLSVSYDKVGDLLVAEGNRGEALRSYRDGLAVREQLAKADPTNEAWQRDLSVSYDKVGDLLVVESNLDEALRSYRASLSVREQLAKADPTNASWQHDLWVSYNKIGEMLVAQGNLSNALQSFRYGSAVGEWLTKADPTNTGWQRDLWVSYNKIGEMLVAQNKVDEALKSFRDGVAIGKRLAKADPTNTGWQRDLSASYNKIGEMLVAQGKLDEALNSYRDGLAITERLAAADPTDAERWRNFQFSIGRIGDLTISLVLARDFAKALEAADLIHFASPGTVLLNMYRARSLMFLGRVEEARTLYARYQREKNVQNWKSWVTLVLEDFAALRKAGLAHPLMDEIEKRFRASR
jgi:tetratricopeptide (TPR) repeat protein